MAKYSTKSPNDAPLCECGCGQETTVYHGTPRRFISGHNARQKLVYTVQPLCECGCGKPTKKSRVTNADRGYIAGEYRHFADRHAPKKPVKKIPVAERFWNLVDQSGGPDACWPWKGSRDRKGYGRWTAGNRGSRQTGGTHRMAYQLTSGSIPDGLVIMHAVCDNPPCCNPAHLKPGTHAENVQDSIKKGRRRAAPSPHGEKHPKAIMSTSQVEECRVLRATGKWTYQDLGKRYGVHSSTIFLIIKGRNRSQG